MPLLELTYLESNNLHWQGRPLIKSLNCSPATREASQDTSRFAPHAASERVQFSMNFIRWLCHINKAPDYGVSVGGMARELRLIMVPGKKTVLQQMVGLFEMKMLVREDRSVLWSTGKSIFVICTKGKWYN
ncbi:hypothetical protein AVEN_120249-1 [Araneus ventricosus]|uniref:Uncharacterized protein n=1 Tax=Araneus ventricosus TaxID=182803 RepID=A0A4Y2QZD9_ARAVE|nr:hypothetical protein AVEN_120249-1 [Araneus ventricosus]